MIYVFVIAIFLFSVIIHEVAHGAVANYLGDPTAKIAGRLTLNPINHIDPMGSILVPLLLFLASSAGGGGVIFGWAKPVPINPLNLRDKKYGQMKTAIAGPLANLSIALFFGLCLRFFSVTPSVLEMFSYIIFINIGLAVFNLMPVPPLDGSHVLMAFLHFSSPIRIFLYNYGFFLILFIIFFFYPFLIYIIDKIFWLFAGFSIL